MTSASRHSVRCSCWRVTESFRGMRYWTPVAGRTVVSWLADSVQRGAASLMSSISKTALHRAQAMKVAPISVKVCITWATGFTEEVTIAAFQAMNTIVRHTLDSIQSDSESRSGSDKHYQEHCGFITKSNSEALSDSDQRRAAHSHLHALDSH